jgi:flagellar basal-body rod modification protein FlgD
MAAAASGIWNHASGAGNSPILAKPQSTTSGSGGTGSSTTDPSTISANDFLTLLVTELQNQDPTSQTDPNEYVNQLVAVNSLEQLININQTLGTALGSSGGTSGGTAPGTVSGASSNAADPAGSTKPPSASAAAATGTGTATATSTPSAGVASTVKTTAGNLGIPDASPAAQRVAQSLGGRLR